MTRDEVALSQESETIVLEVITASAVDFSNQGVPEDYAYRLIFEAFNDEALLKMLQAAWRSARAKQMNK